MKFIKITALIAGATLATHTAYVAQDIVANSDNVESWVRVTGIIAILTVLVLLYMIPGVRNWLLKGIKEGRMMVNFVIPMAANLSLTSLLELIGIKSKHAEMVGSLLSFVVASILSLFMSPLTMAVNIIISTSGPILTYLKNYRNKDVILDLWNKYVKPEEFVKA